MLYINTILYRIEYSILYIYSIFYINVYYRISILPIPGPNSPCNAYSLLHPARPLKLIFRKKAWGISRIFRAICRWMI